MPCQFLRENLSRAMVFVNDGLPIKRVLLRRFTVHICACLGFGWKVVRNANRRVIAVFTVSSVPAIHLQKPIFGILYFRRGDEGMELSRSSRCFLRRSLSCLWRRYSHDVAQPFESPCAVGLSPGLSCDRRVDLDASEHVEWAPAVPPRSTSTVRWTRLSR